MRRPVPCQPQIIDHNGPLGRLIGMLPLRSNMGHSNVCQTY